MKKWVTNTLFGVLIGASCVAIGYGSYMIANKSIKKNIFVPVQDNSYGTSAKEYWWNNSFKVSFRTAAKEFSSGTAWSFYIDEKSSKDYVYWYLATNFHVVNGPLLYNGGANYKPLGLNYRHVVPVTQQFCLQDTTEKGYRSLFSTGIGSNDAIQFDDGSVLSSGLLSGNSDVEIISDNSNKPDNLDNLDLFSNSSTKMNPVTYYNLDMALIRIKMIKSDYTSNSDYRQIFNNISNPYEYWLNQGQNNNLITFDNSKQTFIAGNPSAQHQITFSNIPPGNLQLDKQYTQNKQELDHPYEPYITLTNNVNSLVQKNVTMPRDPKDPNYKGYMSGWKLSAGASGSAVYQEPFKIVEKGQPDTQIIDPKKTIPVGIYWGGWEYDKISTDFFPAFTPFITEQYNIFENFGNALARNFN